MSETERRRTKQIAFNTEHGIVPRGIKKQVREMIDGVHSTQAKDDQKALQAAEFEALSERDVGKRIKQLEKQMLEHAKNLEFEKAARVRDQLATLREQLFGGAGHDNVLPMTGTRA